MTRNRRIAVAALAGTAVAGVAATLLVLHLRSPAPALPPSAGTSIGPTNSAGKPVPPAYIHYYLWWTPGHWRSTLGPNYPLAAAVAVTPENTPPLPGTVAPNGCSTGASYPGDSILDLPAEGVYDQTSAATFDHHIDLAVKSSITGFLVDWKGTGAPGQSPGASGYDSRLDLMVRRVDAYNSAHGTHFSLGLAFAAFGEYNRPAAEIIADLTYFTQRYGKDPAFVNAFSPEPIVMMLDSRKFAVDTVAALSSALGSRMYLVGDETASSWSRDASYLDATSYYWSSENPYTNVRAGASIDALATAVHQSGKRWFAPVIAGYDKQLQAGTCVPRNGVQTLDMLWQINGAGHPDGWFAISWNEFVENTYLEPSLRYGSVYLDELSRLIRSQA